MALALLELTVTLHGDILEQLLVVSIAEAATQDRKVLAGTVNRLRLVTQIDDALPGVPTSVRAELEWAALFGITQLARLRTGAANATSVPLRAVWRDGQLQERLSHSLSDGLTSLLDQPGLTEGDVLLELSNPSATALSTMAAALELLSSRCCGNAAGRAQQRHQSPLNEHSLPEVSVDRWRPSRDGIGAPQQILLDAAAQRAALAENWPSASQVSAQLCRRPESGEHNDLSHSRASRTCIRCPSTINSRDTATSLGSGGACMNTLLPTGKECSLSSDIVNAGFKNCDAGTRLE